MFDQIMIYALPMLLAVAGLFAHWFKKDYKGEMADAFLEYLFEVNPDKSGMTIGAIAIAVGTMVQSGMSVTFDTLTAATAMPYFLLGYTFDSTFNKGSEIATEEEEWEETDE